MWNYCCGLIFGELSLRYMVCKKDNKQLFRARKILEKRLGRKVEKEEVINFADGLVAIVELAIMKKYGKKVFCR